MYLVGKYVVSQFDTLGENYAFLFVGYVAGRFTYTVARCNFPKQFLHYHRAGPVLSRALRFRAVIQRSSTLGLRASLVPSASMWRHMLQLTILL
jgi:hypothetical protein